MDCVVAALAALIERPYEQVVAVAGRAVPNFWKSGIDNKDMPRIAKRLGVKVKWVTVYDIDEDTGVLSLTYHIGTKGHVVLLLEGRIVELEDRPITSWEPAAYMQAHGARPGHLLVRT